MTVFWDVAWCSLVEVTDVSKLLAASIIRAMNVYEVRFQVLENCPETGNDPCSPACCSSLYIIMFSNLT
jgi:hypothetical protein